MSQKAPGKYEREGITLLDLVRMFPDDQAATVWFESVRWSAGRTCGHCKSSRTKSVPNSLPMPYHCSDCRKYFSVRTGTVMQRSKLGLQKWAFGVYLMSTCLKGVSSMKLHRDLGITQKTAWMMGQKIREAWTGKTTPLSGTVEVDEAFIGGKEKNKHAKDKLNAGRGAVGKTAVIGMKARSGEVRAATADNVDGATISRRIYGNVKAGSTVYTDSASAYSPVDGLFYHHDTVNHGIGEYVRGQAHTNGLESFWSMLKRGYQGTYHKMSVKHLDRYVTEFAGRHNVRTLDTLDQMALVVTGMVGKQLPWEKLTA